MTCKQKKDDLYQFHRAALAPLLHEPKTSEFEAACTAAMELDEYQFTDFILQQGLGPLWDAQLENRGGDAPFSAVVKTKLHNSRLNAAGQYLIQRNSLTHIKSILDGAGVDHVVTKGCHTREVYYKNPSLRPAQDIDILISPLNNIKAIKAFQAQGFAFHGSTENIAQDCSLVKGRTDIDLHWDILRPGRTRVPMVESLLGCRTDHGSHWGMSHGGALFLMLVHPVFRKYTNGPLSSLVRLMDIIYLLDRHPESADEARELLQAAGLNTAGWITTTWLHTLTRNSNARALADELRPGKLKQKYFNNWLTANRSNRLFDKPLWIHLGFTLPAHDTWTDAIRATQQATRCKHEANSTLIFIKKQLS
ncbi:MAG: nucleotidyltransferase family protein [Halioglobus sp.]